jgi:hypothetical protein
MLEAEVVSVAREVTVRPLPEDENEVACDVSHFFVCLTFEHLNDECEYN